MSVFFVLTRRPRSSTLFPYTTLFRSCSRWDSPAPLPSLLIRARPACNLRSQAIRSHSRPIWPRSEEHTSELQSHSDLVCRLLLEKKKTVSAAEVERRCRCGGRNEDGV